jgi:hypothetical protein
MKKENPPGRIELKKRAIRLLDERERRGEPRGSYAKALEDVARELGHPSMNVLVAKRKNAEATHQPQPDPIVAMKAKCAEVRSPGDKGLLTNILDRIQLRFGLAQVEDEILDERAARIIVLSIVELHPEAFLAIGKNDGWNDAVQAILDIDPATPVNRGFDYLNGKLDRVVAEINEETGDLPSRKWIAAQSAIVIDRKTSPFDACLATVKMEMGFSRFFDDPKNATLRFEAKTIAEVGRGHSELSEDNQAERDRITGSRR